MRTTALRLTSCLMGTCCCTVAAETSRGSDEQLFSAFKDASASEDRDWHAMTTWSLSQGPNNAQPRTWFPTRTEPCWQSPYNFSRSRFRRIVKVEGEHPVETLRVCVFDDEIEWHLELASYFFKQLLKRTVITTNCLVRRLSANPWQ